MKYVINKFQRLIANTPLLLASIAVLAGVVGFIGMRTQQSKPAAAASCQGICVALTAEGMNPDTLAIKVGEFVQFNTADGQTHNISLGAGDDGHEDKDHAAHDAPHEHVGDYSSGEFGKGEAWKVQFKKTGTFHLHDHHHPNLQILVVVYQPGETSTVN